MIVAAILTLAATNAPTALQASADAPLDLAIVIDHSGSMDWAAPHSDPSGLRFDAASLLIDLVSNQDRIGVVKFSEEATALAPQLTLMDTPKTRQDFQKLIADAKVSDTGLTTEYLKALSQVQALFAQEVLSSNRRAVIFLTDGLPNDANFTKTRLEGELAQLGLSDQQVPVYLMVLLDEEQLTPDQKSRLREVKEAFRTTGVEPITISSPQDIALAFASVLTDLQPNTYLDTLTGVPEQGNKRRFESRTSFDQAVKQATFVFYPSSRREGFAVIPGSTPANADVRTGRGASYGIVSAVSEDNKSLAGQWIFSANDPSARGFAFVRSDVQLEPVYPGRLTDGLFPAHITGESLIIGVRGIGLGTGQTSQMRVKLYRGQCSAALTPETQSVAWDLSPVGLSDDQNIYWREVKELPPGEGPLAISIELAQLDEPLRLRRCFVVQSLPEQPGIVQVKRPAAIDALEGSGIPLELSLSGPVSWQAVDAYVETPTGRVVRVPMDPANPKTTFGQVDSTGIYTITYFARGIDGRSSVALLREAPPFLVEDKFSISRAPIELGVMNRYDQTLPGAFDVAGPFVSSATTASASLIDVRKREDGSLVTDIRVELCEQFEYDEDERTLRCPFVVKPSHNLAEGEYEIVVAVEAGEPLTRIGDVKALFERPASQLIASSAKIILPEIVPGLPALTHTVTFTPVMWTGDPQFPIRSPVQLFANDTNKPMPSQWITAELRPIGAAAQLAYLLSLEPSVELPSGSYRAEVTLNPEAPNLTVEPEALRFLFAKPQATTAATFDRNGRFSAPVWGILFGTAFDALGFNKEATLPITLRTTNLTGPPDLPAVRVTEIRHGDKNVDTDAIAIEWGSLRPVVGELHTYSSDLIVKANDNLDAGLHDISVQFDDPVFYPQQQIFSVRTRGVGALIVQKMLPLIFFLFAIWLLQKSISSRGRAFDGTLVIQGPNGGEWKLSKFRKANTLQFYRDKSLKLNLGPFDTSMSTSTIPYAIRCVNRRTIEIVNVKTGKVHRFSRGETKGWLSYK